MRVTACAILSVSILFVLAALQVDNVGGQDDLPAQKNLAALRAERLEILRRAVSVLESAYRAGTADILTLMTARSDLLEAELEAATTGEQVRKLLQQHSQIAQGARDLAEARHNQGSLSNIQYLHSRARWLEREIRFVEAAERPAVK